MNLKDIKKKAPIALGTFFSFRPFLDNYAICALAEDLCFVDNVFLNSSKTS